jgi:hypothetical protein
MLRGFACELMIFVAAQSGQARACQSNATLKTNPAFYGTNIFVGAEITP